MNTQQTNDLHAAACAVELQAAQHLGVGIPVDPDVADYLGAFTETALQLTDLAEDDLLEVTAQGEVFNASH